MSSLLLGLCFAIGPVLLMHILFVDDTPDTRELYRLFFTCNGHVAQTAPDGSEALRIVGQDSETLDVIILDYHMPGMTGLQVAEHLRRMEGVAVIPIILFTGDSQADFGDKLGELDIACVVYKPIEPRRLVELVQTVVSKA